MDDSLKIIYSVNFIYQIFIILVCLIYQGEM